MAGLQYAGEFVLDHAFINTSSGDRVSIKSSVVEINIFEGIFKNNIHGNILIFDTQNFFSKTYIRGQDTVYLEITTPSISDRPELVIKQHFFVTNVDLMEETASNTMMFRLSFTTKEHFANERTKISKAYQETPTKIIESILRSELNTKKAILIETSNDIKRVVFANKKPFDAIRQIMQEAISKVNGSPSYLFYETTKGFYCRTLTNLYMQPPVIDYNAGEVALLEGGTAKTIDPVKDFERVIEMQLKPNIDSLINTAIGVLASKSTNINLYNKTMGSDFYRHFEEFNKFPRSEGSKELDNPIYNDEAIDNLERTIGDFVDAKTHLTTTFEDNGRDALHYNTQNDINSYSFAPTKIGTNSFLTRQAKRREIDNMVTVKVLANGHVGFEAGQTCTILQPMKDDSGKSVYQGKYLITELRHNFNVGAGNKHEMAMSLSKDSSPNIIEKKSTINFEDYAVESSGGINYVDDIQ